MKKLFVVSIIALNIFFVSRSVLAQANPKVESGLEKAIKRIESKIDAIDKKVDKLAEGKEEIMKELHNVKIWIRRY